MNIGIIGAGAIANFLLKEINEKKQENLKISSLYVRNKEKYAHLESQFGVKLFNDIEDFLNSDVEIVVEAANIEAVNSLIPTVLKKKDTVLISVGALADENLLNEINETVNEYKTKVYLPSGGIGGLDLLQNAHALGTVEDVTLTTRKPAKSLVDEDITEEKVVFEGKAKDAINQFPKNMNISIILSLAGIGSDQTKVRLIADPQVDKNIHQIDISGGFGDATLTISNNPLPENPRTSYLAAMSILGTLNRLDDSLKIGG